jgi:hypothetical protein
MRSRGWTLIVSLLAVAGCQDYGFEEVNSAVIREKRVLVRLVAAPAVDILFVIDNSRSMVGEQLALANSFGHFVAAMDEKFGSGAYQIAVVTTGLESPACLPCPADDPDAYSCINPSGENGRFQNLRGKLVGGDPDAPIFDFIADPSCRLVGADNLACFFDPSDQRGTVLVGTSGCGLERGLAAVQAALSPGLLGSPAANGGFLRPEAQLAVIVVSDEEDCGQPGEVIEQGQGFTQNGCYYAAAGVGPDGSTTAPDGTAYGLEDLDGIYDFLMRLKNHQKGLVKFAAIVGVEDAADPAATRIRYASQAPNAAVLPACTTPGCSGVYCDALPGTRYVQLAERFGLGENGFVDTICQPDFNGTMAQIPAFLDCPRLFRLTEQILDPALANILINREPVPRYSCADEAEVVPCDGSGDPACGPVDCVETWSYHPPADPPDPSAPGGTITFAAHFDACGLIEQGEIVIELIYATP